MKTLALLGALLLATLCADARADQDERVRRAFAAASDEIVAQVTPVLMRLLNAPLPVKGSDGRYHLVYELEVSNFAGTPVRLDAVDVLDARSQAVVASLDSAAIAARLVVRDKAAVPGTLDVAQAGLIYVHVTFNNAPIARVLEHRLSAITDSAVIVETAARTRVHKPTHLVLEPPLRGSNYIAGDGCCDSVRHVRATLPVNGQPFTAQRFAIDWEQLDDQNRIYVGDPAKVTSYVIYDKPVYAAADARVVTAVDGLDDTPPGALPVGIPFEQADGNHVVLDLGDGRFALYAHLAPGSVQVSAGQHVRRGQLLGRVGSSGNSSEPHLHFHVTDGPSPLASNGVPYLLTQFDSIRRGISTAAFDDAIVSGQPPVVEPVAGDARRERVMPLDLWIIDFR